MPRGRGQKTAWRRNGFSSLPPSSRLPDPAGKGPAAGAASRPSVRLQPLWVWVWVLMKSYDHVLMRPPPGSVAFPNPCRPLLHPLSCFRFTRRVHTQRKQICRQRTRGIQCAFLPPGALEWNDTAQSALAACVPRACREAEILWSVEAALASTREGTPLPPHTPPCPGHESRAAAATQRHLCPRSFPRVLQPLLVASAPPGPMEPASGHRLRGLGIQPSICPNST